MISIDDTLSMVSSLALALITISFVAPLWFFRENDASITLRPCPNPNCIRCRKYKSAQQNAIKRLPYLVQELKLKKNKGSSSGFIDIDIDTDTHIDMENIRRIEDGVRKGPPPLPSERRYSFWRNGHDYHYAYGNANDQFPSVLFVPRLPVHRMATHLHAQVCDLLSASASSAELNHGNHNNNNNKANKKSRREMMMDEYLNAQLYDGAWNTNDSGALNDPKGQKNNTHNHQLWQVLYLMNQGRWIEQNIQLCKGTYSLLQQIPQEMLMAGCMFGNIFFSVLYPGTKIEEHCGPSNVRHRLHFPLLVPSPSHKEECSSCLSRPTLTVGGEVMHWREGDAFVFDDSLLHCAKYPDNDESSEVRVVLVLDLWHPSLSHDERSLVTDLYPLSS